MRISNIFIIFSVYSAYLIFLTYMNSGDIKDIIINSIQLVALIGIVEVFSKNIFHIVDAMLIHFELSVYVNLLTLILFPDGLFSRYNSAYGYTIEWFLGAPNNFIYWLLPGIILCWVSAYKSSKKLRPILFTTAVIGTLFLKGSGTLIVAIGVFLIYILFPQFRKVISPIKGLVISLIAFLCIVVFRKFNFLAPLIVGVLHKDLTFSSRIYIWNNAINEILRNPFLGHGYLSTNQMVSYLGKNIPGRVTIWSGASHAHSQFLQIIFQGGMIGVVFLILIYWEILRTSYLQKNNVFVQILSWGIVAVTVAGIAEVLISPLVFVLFAIVTHISDLNEETIITEKGKKNV